MLPREAIEEFKQLYLRTFGEDISDAEATRRANNLMRLYRAVLFPSRGMTQNVSESYERPTAHQ